ncbi:LysR family transcriptional regulator [Pelagibius marinus]|uniref:LysR family transcriptional regulator n=1 Tax=Pelagibius marinus TaxID=2762760 RepID=UPI001872ACD4|nr:LysR family transcriptional regulator [Pelagibius marinus]
MKRYRSSLPPLDALIFFEAAARMNSFTHSAAELNVTQAAVSKRIRELETHLGTALFEREGRKLALTDAGAALYDKTVMALEFLDSACKNFGDDRVEIIKIAANNSVSHFWLSPRLKKYSLTNPAQAVETRTSDRLSDIIDTGNDLAIIYGYGDTPGWDCKLLFSERLVPVASPGYLRSLGLIDDDSLGGLDAETASRLVLLNFDRLAPDWVNWSVWIAESGLTVLRHAQLHRCQNYAQTVGLATEGRGLALGSHGIIDAELSAGGLQVLGSTVVETGRGYFLGANATRRQSDGVRALFHFLEED